MRPSLPAPQVVAKGARSVRCTRMPKPASPQFLATLGRTIEEGVALQRQGRLAEAEKVYTRILKTLPDKFETLQLLAELKMQRGKPGEAFRHMSAAVAARPT